MVSDCRGVSPAVSSARMAVAMVVRPTADRSCAAELLFCLAISGGTCPCSRGRARKRRDRRPQRSADAGSRNAGALSREQVRSAAYESASENLVDSIVAPIFWFAVFEILFGMGIVGAALFRAANTMDSMLGYKDDRIRVGWFAARMDDLLAWIPARITGVLLLTLFACRHRARAALGAFRADRKKRPWFNGGIPMSLIAGGCGVMFDKPGVYTIGSPERTLAAGGRCIIRIMRETTVLFSALVILVILMGISHAAGY